jgi:hypothetical protein
MKKELLAELKEGDILLVFNNDELLSHEIARTTHSSYSHCTYVLNNKRVIETVPLEVKITKVRHYSDGRYDLCLLRSFLTQDQIEEKTAYLMDKIGITKYFYIRYSLNWVKSKFGINTNLDKKFSVCSELIAEADLKLFNKQVMKGTSSLETKPGHYLHSINYKVIGVYNCSI